MNVRLSVVVVCAVLIATLAAAQSPFVVTTLPAQSNTRSSNTSRFTAVGETLYFFAYPDGGSAALWKWTEAGGAERVKQIFPNYYHAPVDSLTMLKLGTKLLFSAAIDARGHELWITDGTTAGTTLVKDIYSGGGSAPTLHIVAGTKAYFTAYHPDNGRELWVTDGTEAGTMLVKDLTGDSASTYPIGFATAGGNAYFHAADQLFVTDGTAAGTTALASGVGGAPAGVINENVLFLGSDATHGRELWITNGTTGGTAMLADINPGAASSWGGLPTSFAQPGAAEDVLFVQTGSSLYFFAEDATNGRELWKTDGTASGTQLVKDITPGAASSGLSHLVASSAGVFFLVDRSTLWFSNGTADGTIALGSYPSVQAMAGASNGAYLITRDRELIFSNGTPGGTIEITGVTAGTAPHLTATGGMVLFNGNDGTPTGIEPWVTDGTQAGTHLLADIDSVLRPFPGLKWMRAAGSNVFFAYQSKIFRSDGTAAGTFEVAAFGSNTYYSPPAGSAIGSTFLFAAGTEETLGLWKSDGTLAGTTLVEPFADIDSIFTSSAGYGLLLASKTSTYNGTRLWATDGTSGGTVALGPTIADTFVDLAGRTYFLSGFHHWDGDRRELWRTDGTAASTRLILKGNFKHLAAAGGTLYLARHETATGHELWKSDGTGDHLTLVKDIRTGSASSSPSSFTPVGNVLFFIADDGVHGNELWRSDGTEAGTFMVKDIGAGSSSVLSDLVASGPYLYFTRRESGGSSSEMWRSDGTAAGTIRLTEPAHHNTWLTPFDGTLMFAGSDTFRGAELWQSDGSIGGTFPFADLIAGVTSSSPGSLTVARDLISSPPSMRSCGPFRARRRG